LYTVEKCVSDIERKILERLIDEENEFVISAFDVNESDKNFKELVDTLKKIVKKAMSQKLQNNNVSDLIPDKNNNTNDFSYQASNETIE